MHPGSQCRQPVVKNAAYAIYAIQMYAGAPRAEASRYNGRAPRSLHSFCISDLSFIVVVVIVFPRLCRSNW